MSSFTRIEQEEIERLHRRACEYVENNMRDGKNMNMHIPALIPHCRISHTHLVCPLENVGSYSLSAETVMDLERNFPGFTYDHEKHPQTGEWKIYLNLPILFEKNSTFGGGGGGARRARFSGATKPTLETPFMLLVAEAVLVGLLYWRVAAL